MKRRELFKHSLVISASAFFGGAPRFANGTTASREFPQGFDASQVLAAEGWEPQFLTEHQNQTLIVLSDLIIPETDTPGAKAALANRFIDHLLAAEELETQRNFLGSLAYLDGESRRRYNKAFLYLESNQQKDLLTFMAYPHRLVTWKTNVSNVDSFDHFLRLKDWVSRAFYSSEAGLRELGWEGSSFHEPFEGCQHSEGGH